MNQSDYIAQLENENATLKAKVAQLEQDIARLLQKVEASKVRKDSKNSNLPPSQDIVKKNQSLRPKSGRKPGGQAGHKGSTLLMKEEPDQVIKLQPDYCNDCGGSLKQEKASLREKRQVADIPHIELKWVEYQQYEKLCPCCNHLQSATFPPGVDNHVQYGPNIHAMSAYLHSYQYLPYHRMKYFFEQCCSAALSVGTLRNIVKRMADKARPVYGQLRQMAQDSPATGGDETSANVNGKKQWVWVWQSAVVTFIAISVSRGKELIGQLFPQGLKGILCSDRWRAQLSTVAEGHQLCLAHLLRELNYLVALEKLDWAARFKELLCDAIALKKAKAAYSKQDKQPMGIESRCTALLAELVGQGQSPKTVTFQNSMNTYRDFLFPFLYDPLIPFDNNASERAIRNVKVKLKVSGQFKSGQEDYCILRSLIDTTLKNKGSVFKVFQQLYFIQPTPAE